MSGVHRIKIHVPAHDAMPVSVRGVASAITCGLCGAKLRGRTHAEARNALRFHNLDQHTNEQAAALSREAASAAREKEGS